MRKGIFIPEITVEMFRNATLEAVEELLVSGTMEDIEIPDRPHGEWEALGFQQGYAFCRCSNCHKTMRLYLDSKNEFCCIADIRKKVVSCMYCGASMQANDRQVTGKLDENTQKHYGFRKKY